LNAFLCDNEAGDPLASPFGGGDVQMQEWACLCRRWLARHQTAQARTGLLASSGDGRDKGHFDFT
jgi:hypothetical protein